MSSEIRKRRILERCRHAFLTWIYSDDDDNNEEDRLKCRKPKSIKNIDGISIGGGNGGVIGGSGAIKNGTNGSSSNGQHDDGDTATSTTSSGNGLRRILVSPSTAITSNLNVDILEIPQGKHLIHNISYGVECYYVIQGSGTYSYSNVHSNSLLDRAIDDGEDATDKNLEYAICEGEAFVVDHGRYAYAFVSDCLKFPLLSYLLNALFLFVSFFPSPILFCRSSFDTMHT